MRTYGRIMVNGVPQWVQVNTDVNGYNDAVWITTLAQVLKLNLGESPFWSNYGIPAKQAVIQQVFPDFYVVYTQQNFAQHFANLQITKQDLPTPTYNISVLTNQGSQLNFSVPIPV